MKTSNRGIELIKRLEGFAPQAYLCPASVWTIGYGHTSDVKSGDVVTEAQADELLRIDLKRAEKAVNAENLQINQCQFDALVSFVFNVGVGSFTRSTLLRKVKGNSNDATIADEFRKWMHAGNVILPGLQMRREAEIKRYYGLD